MDTVHKIARKIKLWVKILNRREDVFIVFLILLVGFGGFGLGRLSKIEEGRGSVRVTKPNGVRLTSNVEDVLGEQNFGGEKNTLAPVQTSESTLPPLLSQNGGQFVASQNGGKYHHPWCPGAVRIKEENKVWFNSKEEAEKAGYQPATNCKGL